MGKEWWEDKTLEELEDEERSLQAALAYRPYRYKPGMYSPTRRLLRKALSEEYIEKIEEEGDIDEVTKKFLKKILRQPGATKKTGLAYLERALEKAKAEGRI